MLDIDANPFDDELDHCHKYCNVWVATAIIGGALVGGIGTAYAANKGAKAIQNSAQTAANTTLGMFNTTREDLAPYRQIGQNANTELQSRLPFLTSPITMDQATLEQTPGYQFTRTQGLKAVQNSAAARGLGSSGAAQKGAAAYATGLADQTYQTQFNLENTNRTNAFNRLMGLIGTGANAAAGGGQIGQQAAQTAASAQIAGGNAQAAGYNALGSAAQGVGNSVAGYGLYKGLYGDKNNNNQSSGDGTNSSWSIA